MMQLEGDLLPPSACSPLQPIACVCVYPQVVCLDLEPYMVEFSAPFFEASGLSSRIRPVVGPADETMQQLAAQGERYGLADINSLDCID